jgi:hypothetical protein
MRNRVATWVNLVFASIVVVGVFLQAYFIAAYFSGAAWRSRRSPAFASST